MADDDDAKPPRRLHPRQAAGLVLLVLVVIFIFENTSKTSIRFIVPRVRIHVWVALFVATLFGGVAGALMARRHRD